MKHIYAVVPLALCLLQPCWGAAGPDVVPGLLKAIGVPPLPPMAPGGDETPAAAASDSVTNKQLVDCYARTQETFADANHAWLHAKLGPPHITYAPNWGYVLRADFTRVGVAPPLVNRVVCAKNGSITAIKLDVPALDTAP